MPCWSGDVGSLDLKSSRAFINSDISAGTVLNWCHREGIWCDMASRMMTRKLLALLVFDGCDILLSQSPVSLLYRSQLAFFKLRLVRCSIWMIVQTNEDW